MVDVKCKESVILIDRLKPVYLDDSEKTLKILDILPSIASQLTPIPRVIQSRRHAQ